MSREGGSLSAIFRFCVIGSDLRRCLSSAAILLLLQANPRCPIGLRAARCSQPERLVEMATKSRRLAGNSRLVASVVVTSLRNSYRRVPRWTVTRSLTRSLQKEPENETVENNRHRR